MNGEAFTFFTRCSIKIFFSAFMDCFLVWG